MAQMKTINFKRGDTLAIACTRKNSVGAPVNITGMTILSKVRNGAFEDSLVVNVTDAAAGEFTLSRSAANTAAWPLTADGSIMRCDVEFTDGSNVNSSETFAINVIEDITL